MMMQILLDYDISGALEMMQALPERFIFNNCADPSNWKLSWIEGSTIGGKVINFLMR
jgi:hypothetical protein